MYFHLFYDGWEIPLFTTVLRKLLACEGIRVEIQGGGGGGGHSQSNKTVVILDVLGRMLPKRILPTGSTKGENKRKKEGQPGVASRQ